jgi:Ca2+-binding RTX toxin-like protein
MRLTPRHPHRQDDSDAGVRLQFDYEGTAGDDRLKGSRGDDLLDLSQGGDDFAIGSRGSDTFYFGASFTSADRVKGGNDAGTDRVDLEGDYSAGLELRPTSLIGVEVLSLSGGSYVLTGELGKTGRDGYVIISADGLDQTHSLDLDVFTAGRLYANGGAGDDVLRAPSNDVGGSLLFGGWGDDVLIGGGGGATLAGYIGSDRIVMRSSGDRAGYGIQEESSATSYDTIEGFAASGGKIELSFDSDTTKLGLQHKFHIGETRGHAGDITFSYDADSGETIVSAFTNADDKPDFVVHLVGNVSLTIDDLVF